MSAAKHVLRRGNVAGNVGPDRRHARIALVVVGDGVFWPIERSVGDGEPLRLVGRRRVVGVAQLGGERLDDGLLGSALAVAECAFRRCRRRAWGLDPPSCRWVPIEIVSRRIGHVLGSLGQRRRRAQRRYPSTRRGVPIEVIARCIGHMLGRFRRFRGSPRNLDPCLGRRVPLDVVTSRILEVLGGFRWTAAFFENFLARRCVNACGVAGRPDGGSRRAGSGVKPASHALHVRVGTGTGDKTAAQSGEPFALPGSLDDLGRIASGSQDDRPESVVLLDLGVVHFDAGSVSRSVVGGDDGWLRTIAGRAGSVGARGFAAAADEDGHRGCGVEGARARCDGGGDGGLVVLLGFSFDVDEPGVGDFLVAARHAKADFGSEGSCFHLLFRIAESRLRQSVGERERSGRIRVVLNSEADCGDGRDPFAIASAMRRSGAAAKS